MDEKKMRKMYVEEHTVRFVALQVIILTIIVLYSKWYWLAILLGLDFAVRAFTVYATPLSLLARALHKVTGQTNKPVFAPPKRFAATMGFAFCIAISICFYFQLAISAYIIGGVLLICAGLESFFNFCVGCYVYDKLVAPFKN